MFVGVLGRIKTACHMEGLGMDGKVMLMCLEEIRVRIRSSGCTVRRFWFCNGRGIS
jgi:hypothetical protein